MAMFYEWVDFVTYPTQPDRVKSLEDRLDTRAAVPSAMAPQLLDDSSQGFIVAGEVLVGLGDPFQAMEVDPYGNVTIWGVHHVYRLQRWYGIEKLIFLPWHPPSAAAGPHE